MRINNWYKEDFISLIAEERQSVINHRSEIVNRFGRNSKEEREAREERQGRTAFRSSCRRGEKEGQQDINHRTLGHRRTRFAQYHHPCDMRHMHSQHRQHPPRMQGRIVQGLYNARHGRHEADTEHVRVTEKDTRD